MRNVFRSKPSNKTFIIDPDKGIQLPNLTPTERNALVLTASDKGFLIINSVDNRLEFWNGTSWRFITDSAV